MGLSGPACCLHSDPHAREVFNQAQVRLLPRERRTTMASKSRLVSALVATAFGGWWHSAEACDLRTAEVVAGCDCKWTLNVDGTSYPGNNPTPFLTYRILFTNLDNNQTHIE